VGTWKLKGEQAISTTPVMLTPAEQDALIGALRGAELKIDYEAADALEQGRVLGRLIDWVNEGETLVPINQIPRKA